MHIEFFFHWRADSFFHIINYYNIFAIMYVNTKKKMKNLLIYHLYHLKNIRKMYF